MELEININQYINGELSGTDLEQFKALLKKDKALQKQVQFHLEVDKALVANDEVEENQNLKSILRQLGKTHIQDVNKKVSKPFEEKEKRQITADPEILPENRGNFKRLVPFAVLAAAAAFLLFMFLPSLQNQSNPQIADNYFQAYQFNDNFLGREGSEDILKKANENYTDGNWKGAKNNFIQYLQVNPKVPKVLLAKGCAEFELTEFEAAIGSFNQVLDAEDSDIYQPLANWYLALCYLKKDDELNAIKHLKDIKKGQDYFDDARKLLQQLK